MPINHLNNPVTVAAGSSTVLTLTPAAGLAGGTYTVKPAGVSCGTVAAFVPSSLGTAKSLPLFSGLSAVPGTYTIQVVGTSATKQHAISVQLTIN